MTTQHRILAEIHKAQKPADPRTLDELESYYRNLQHSSPFARAVQQVVAEDTASTSQEFALQLPEWVGHDLNGSE